MTVPARSPCVDAQAALVRSLLDPACYAHPVSGLRLLETHISYVILTGTYAYKIKKPLDLGFLDFTSLERRRFFCQEEVRLNRRLAPEIYLDVVPISAGPDRPVMGGEGAALEYAVRMKEFSQADLLDRVTARGELTVEQVEQLAADLAAFHARAAPAAAHQPFGAAPNVTGPAAQNFEQLLPMLPTESLRRRALALQRWSRQQGESLAGAFQERKARGSVRECHGDLHLGNMALVDGRIAIFDCIEFEPNLRWIDVMSEVAFLVMDLFHRGEPGLARRFLNAYLEAGGDYEGLRVLRYYLVYRCLVRAKVTAIRAGQEVHGEAALAFADVASYLDLAQRFTRPAPALLLLTLGLSGSGKSRFSRRLLEHMDAVQLRSDVERKRLAGLDALARSGSGVGAGLYQEQMTRRTYEHLRRLARGLLDAGWSVIVDATFLKYWQREPYHHLAAEAGVKLAILEFTASEAVLRERLRQRALKPGTPNASEAGEDVLDWQLAEREPLTAEERDVTVTINTEATPQPKLIADRLAALAASYS